MPLVPGVQITNAIRDLLAGHYVSGVSRGTEAMMTATMIGFAIAFIFQLFIRKGTQVWGRYLFSFLLVFSDCGICRYYKCT